jgi:phenylacetate-CoA ligase
MFSYNKPKLKDFYDKMPVFVQNLMTSLYGLQHRRRVHGRYYPIYLEALKKSQWYSLEELKELQNSQLRRFISYAYDHSPYWHRIFSELGFKPDMIKRAEDLHLLPLLEKETVRQHIESIISDEYRNGVKRKEAVPVHTSGTTGKALHLTLSRECWEREYAFRDLHRSWGGIKPGDRIATFAGHPVVPTDRMKPPFWRENWTENQVVFSSQHIAPHTLHHYVEKLIKFQPDLIHGYPSALYLVALYLDAQGIRAIRPKAVYTHSETLLDYQRDLLERVFGCKVFNWYGNTEMCANIVECEKGSLHVKLEHSVVEFLRPDGEPAKPGEIGEMVCTGFGNYATPLIRYRVGDVAVVSDRSCSCGRAGPLVKEVVGRVEDIIVTPDGRHVGRLDHVFKDMLNVVEAQIIQEDINSVLIRIVKRPGFGENDMHLLERELRLRLGPIINLQYEFVNQIPREPNGKFRFAISKVPLRIGARSE